MKAVTVTVALAILCGCVNRSAVGSEANLPTLHLNQEIRIVSGEPERGMLVAVGWDRDPGKVFVYRLMGMPGDTIRLISDDICKGASSCSGRAGVIGTLFEYRINGGTEWQRAEQTVTDSLPAAIARNVQESETLQKRAEFDGQPIILSEKIGQRQYYIVEMQEKTIVPGLCNTIETTGCTIPPDQYFVLGDNRDDARDSRFMGFVNRKNYSGLVRAD